MSQKLPGAKAQSKEYDLFLPLIEHNAKADPILLLV